jgi:gamma-glutamyltranspeptidase/glutathione hydrolase
VLAEGGNAVDAATAIAFTLAVTLPRAGNLGGDGFMTLYRADTKKITVIDFRSVAPRAAKLDMFLKPDGKEAPEASVGSARPPYPARSRVYGSRIKNMDVRLGRNWSSSARLMAQDGIVLSADEAFVFSWGRKRLSASDAALKTF